MKRVVFFNKTIIIKYSFLLIKFNQNLFLVAVYHEKIPEFNRNYICPKGEKKKKCKQDNNNSLFLFYLLYIIYLL